MMSESVPSSGVSPGSSQNGKEYPSLQDGIYFRHGVTPDPCYRLLLLNIKAGVTPGEAKAAITSVWTMLQELCDRDLASDAPTGPPGPSIPAPDAKLTCLLGFGARLFDHYPTMSRPEELRHLDERPFRSLRWVAAKADRRRGEADLALQFIAKTELAVNRAVVEVWMLIQEPPLRLEIVTFHGGFNRDDHRSWLGFRDGTSNIESSQRGAAIAVVRKTPAWMEGGTYMAFLRLAIDLQAWRHLPREHQEILVGRDKVTGCPLEDVAPGLVPVPLKGCPMLGKGPGSPAYNNPPPPPTHVNLLRASHLHRANPNRNVPVRDEDNRIFRQGYEFVEPVADGRLRLGLNFVSFQRRLAHLTNILALDGWLGNVNFGGFADQRAGAPAPITLLEVIAGGYYAVPPKADPFPGADIF